MKVLMVVKITTLRHNTHSHSHTHGCARAHTHTHTNTHKHTQTHTNTHKHTHTHTHTETCFESVMPKIIHALYPQSLDTDLCHHSPS